VIAGALQRCLAGQHPMNDDSQKECYIAKSLPYEMFAEFSLKIQFHCEGGWGVKVRERYFRTKVSSKIMKITFL
jgi:hypothetical protein